MQLSIFRRVRLVDSAGDDRDGSPVRIAPRCAAVSIPRASPETTTSVAASSAARVSAMRCPLAEALRPPTAATHRCLRQRGVAADDQARRRIIHHRQQRRVIRIAQKNHPPASATGAFKLPLRLRRGQRIGARR